MHTIRSQGKRLTPANKASRPEEEEKRDTWGWCAHANTTTHTHPWITCGADLDYRATQTEKVCGQPGGLPCLCPHPSAPADRHTRPIHTSIQDRRGTITLRPPSSPPLSRSPPSLIWSTVPAPGLPNGHFLTSPHSRPSIGSRWSHAAYCRRSLVQARRGGWSPRVPSTVFVETYRSL